MTLWFKAYYKTDPPNKKMDRRSVFVKQLPENKWKVFDGGIEWATYTTEEMTKYIVAHRINDKLCYLTQQESTELDNILFSNRLKSKISNFVGE